MLVRLNIVLSVLTILSFFILLVSVFFVFFSFFFLCCFLFFFQAEDGIRDLVRSRGLGDVYKRQGCGDVRRSAIRERSVSGGLAGRKIKAGRS